MDTVILYVMHSLKILRRSVKLYPSYIEFSEFMFFLVKPWRLFLWQLVIPLAPAERHQRRRKIKKQIWMLSVFKNKNMNIFFYNYTVRPDRL